MEDLFRSMYVRQQQQQQLTSGSQNGSVCGPCQAQKKTAEVYSHDTHVHMHMDSVVTVEIWGEGTPFSAWASKFIARPPAIVYGYS